MANTRQSKKTPEANGGDEIVFVEKQDDDKIKERPTVKEVDVHEYVTVRNGFPGKLVYISKRTGERFVWSDFGDEQEIELLELKNAKNSSKKFFINNWFMFDEAWIPKYLGVGQYYRYAVGIDDFDDLFVLTPAEIEERISKMSKGQKRSVAYRARTLIADGGIDSNRVIKALEKALGVDLVEK